MSLFPKTQVVKDPFNHLRLVNEADNPHLALVLGQVNGSVSYT